MDEQQYYTIVLRHDTSTQWMVNDPILALGEYGVEDDTHKVKRGDGESKWSELFYEDFGLQYIVTFANLTGDITDNEKLTNKFASKVNIASFSDVNNKVISAIDIVDELGCVGTIRKVVKDVQLASTAENILKIVSDDNSVQGYWSITNDGVRILDLRARSSIDDYKADFEYFEDQLCFYNNRLYRALDNFTSTSVFDEKHWVILASLKSNDIKYDNKVSGLEAQNVKEALDELTDLDSAKVKKTQRENKVYGTNEDGEQFLYNKDD